MPLEGMTRAYHCYRRAAGVVAFAAAVGGCTGKGPPALSKPEALEIPNVPVPPEHGPRLASISDRTAVRQRPDLAAAELGYLHAGGRIARAELPYSRSGCDGGWYPVRPAGFVCSGNGATTDLSHPTLAAMAIQPLLDQPLPYTYARTRAVTSLLERDPSRSSAVREISKLKRRAGLAVVGSWTADTPGGTNERLALLTSGKFVKAADLEALEPSAFAGVELTKERPLPIAFVVKRGVRTWKLGDSDPTKDDDLEYHQALDLTGRFRTVKGEKFWATRDDRWVRHRDVTVVLERHRFPDFVQEGQKWVDVSVITGTLVAYEGKRPFLATLVSVARGPELLGESVSPEAALAGEKTDAPKPKAPDAFALGSFEVVAKHVTLVGGDPFAAGESHELLDLPWALELSSGRSVYAAYFHDRFGIDHGPGSIQLSPRDAVRLFQWVTPSLPEGWHSKRREDKDEKTLFVLRK
jgi:hypothetical protein